MSKLPHSSDDAPQRTRNDEDKSAADDMLKGAPAGLDRIELAMQRVAWETEPEEMAQPVRSSALERFIEERRIDERRIEERRGDERRVKERRLKDRRQTKPDGAETAGWHTWLAPAATALALGIGIGWWGGSRLEQARVPVVVPQPPALVQQPAIPSPAVATPVQSPVVPEANVPLKLDADVEAVARRTTEADSTTAAGAASAPVPPSSRRPSP